MALQAVDLGKQLSNVKVMRGGWYWWLELGYPVEK